MWFIVVNNDVWSSHGSLERVFVWCLGGTGGDWVWWYERCAEMWKCWGEEYLWEKPTRRNIMSRGNYAICLWDNISYCSLYDYLERGETLVKGGIQNKIVTFLLFKYGQWSEDVTVILCQL